MDLSAWLLVSHNGCGSRLSCGASGILLTTASVMSRRCDDQSRVGWAVALDASGKHLSVAGLPLFSGRLIAQGTNGVNLPFQFQADWSDLN